MKASYCEDCKHYAIDPDDDTTWHRPCEFGHKPRFYRPLTLSQAHSNDWGWKRRCHDFEAKLKEKK